MGGEKVHVLQEVRGSVAWEHGFAQIQRKDGVKGWIRRCYLFGDPLSEDVEQKRREAVERAAERAAGGGSEGGSG